MPHPTAGPIRGLAALGLVALAVAASGCGAAAAKVSGTANVAYAGSLELLMEHSVGPAFTHRTGYHYQGRGGGSLGLAQEVRSGEIRPNVFISVGGGPLALLEPKFTNWAVQFASSPLVLAYQPNSPYAAELGQIAKGKLPIQDLFTVLAEKGFRLGRTDPNTDPQGQDFAMMFQLAQNLYQVPAATVSLDLGGGSAQIYPETALDSQLQAGQLDAASAFRSQALQLHLPFVPLPAPLDFASPQDSSTYARASLHLSTGAEVHGFLLNLEATALGKQPPAAAAAFVAYLISPAGRAILSREGYDPLPATVFGRRAGVPQVVLKATS